MHHALIFADETQLDTNLHELGVSTEGRTQNRKKHFELSLTGPKVSISEEATSRILNVVERIDLLLRTLEEQDLLVHRRPYLNSEERVLVDKPLASGQPILVLEECTATRVLVPSKQPTTDHPAFALWLSAPPTPAEAMLVLLETSEEGRTLPTQFSPLSTFSALQSLLYFTRQRPNLLADALGFRVKSDSHPGMGTMLADIEVRQRRFLEEFCTDPISFLEQWNCKPLLPRAVKALYRIREFGRDGGPNHGLTVFAYPIFIAALGPEPPSGRLSRPNA